MNAVKVFLKGMAMGAADVVPGVSGGTIAFITGIYARLLNAIASVNLQLLKTLRQQGIKAAWAAMDGNFLLALGAGILTAIVSLARVIHFLLEQYPTELWSFFFGLIIAASLHIARTITQWRWQEGVALILGILISAGISLVGPAETEPTTLALFLAGSIAICAMILPGISGSFILLLMGLYAPVVAAVKNADIGALAVLAAGAGLGLLLFSRVLNWLLHHFMSVTMALLTGFMLGSLVKVWPWKEVVQTRVNSQGETVPFIETPVLPLVDESLLWAVGLMCVGAMLVLAMEKLAGGESDAKV